MENAAHVPTPTDSAAEKPPVHPRMTASPFDVDLGDPQKIAIADIDPDQKWNTRAVITKAQLDERIRGLAASGRPDQNLVVFPHEKGSISKYKWRCLAGNLSLLAARALVERGDRRFAELWACVFKGSRRQASLLMSRNNEAHQPTTSYDKARDLLRKKEEFNYRSTAELVADCNRAGWDISVQQADNLMSALRQLIPELQEAWKWAQLPVEEKPALMKTQSARDIEITDPLIYWAKGRPVSVQHDVWRALRKGEHWKSVKARFETKTASNFRPTFMGLTFKARPPTTYQALLIYACQQIRDAQLPPVAAAAAEAAVKYVLTGSQTDNVVAEIRKLAGEPEIQKTPARPAPKKAPAKTGRGRAR